MCIHTHTHVLFCIFFFIMVYYGKVNMVHCGVQQDFVVYPLYVQQFASAEHRLPICPSPCPSLLGTASLFSRSHLFLEEQTCFKGIKHPKALFVNFPNPIPLLGLEIKTLLTLRCIHPVHVFQVALGSSSHFVCIINLYHNIEYLHSLYCILGVILSTCILLKCYNNSES